MTAPPAKPAMPPPAALALLDAPSDTHRFTRRMVDCGGRSFQLFQAIPLSDAPPEGYPTLTMLDGNAAFDSLTPEHLAAVPGLAIIGAGHDTPLRFHVGNRSLDYTPSRDGQGPAPDPQRPERMIGGAAIFLEILCGGLREAAEEGFCADPARRSLWGHSLAGQFVLYALLTRPWAFSGYAAISPSLWWGDEFLLGLERAARFPDGPAADILIMLGDSEKRSSATGPHWDGPAPHTLEMVERLRARPGLRVSAEIFTSLGHAATLPASLPASLKFAAKRVGRRCG